LLSEEKLSTDETFPSSEEALLEFSLLVELTFSSEEMLSSDETFSSGETLL
jgi:hypothetical protein